MGEWVDLDAPVPGAPVNEPAPSSWMLSSFDLLRGTEVSDDPSKVPDALWDEFFTPKPAGTGTDDK